MKRGSVRRPGSHGAGPGAEPAPQPPRISAQPRPTSLVQSARPKARALPSSYPAATARPNERKWGHASRRDCFPHRAGRPCRPHPRSGRLAWLGSAPRCPPTSRSCPCPPKCPVGQGSHVTEMCCPHRSAPGSMPFRKPVVSLRRSGKKIHGVPTQPTPQAVRQAIIERLLPSSPRQCPSCGCSIPPLKITFYQSSANGALRSLPFHAGQCSKRVTPARFNQSSRKCG